MLKVFMVKFVVVKFVIGKLVVVKFIVVKFVFVKLVVCKVLVRKVFVKKVVFCRIVVVVKWLVYGIIIGLFVMIGLGLIGKGMLLLIECYFKFDKFCFIVIDLVDMDVKMVIDKGYGF